MNHVKLSIIIPHYNIPDLLARCLRSIPVRDDIQVIVVDDCSPNATTYPDRVVELQRPNVEFYTTQRGGSAGRARNVGLIHARGEWLAFVDADDFLPDHIETLFESLWQRTEELIFTDYRTVLSDDPQVQSSRDQKYHNLIQQYLQEGNEDPLRLKFDPLWGKMIRHDLVSRHQIKFDETRWSNDAFFALKVGTLAQSIHVCNKVGYILTERQGSLANNYCGTVQETSVRMEVALRMKEFLLLHHKPQRYSSTIFIDSFILSNFSYLDRLRIAWHLRHYVRYAIHLIASFR